MILARKIFTLGLLPVVTFILIPVTLKATVQDHTLPRSNSNVRDSITVNLSENSMLTATDSVSISMADSLAYNLDNLVVTARKKLVESNGETITYNMSEDPEAGSATLLDILRKVPGVTVDGEDNIKVNGQSQFKILIDGKENAMFKGDIKIVLKSIPSSSIKKIEVIKDPGAKFDAEGVGGILNFVTDKSRSMEGYIIQLDGWISNYNGGGSADAKFKINKVTMNINVTHNNGRIFPRWYENFGDNLNLTESNNHFLEYYDKSKHSWDYTGVRFNMSWEPDSLNLITVGGIYAYNSWDNDIHRKRTMYDLNDKKLWEISQNISHPGKYNGMSYQASYQHNFKNPDHNLVLSYMIDNSLINSYTTSQIESVTGDISHYPYTYTENPLMYPSQIFQIDYSNRVNEHNKIEAGGKISINREKSENREYSGDDSSDITEIPENNLKLTQIKDIYAAYVSYNGNWNKWELKGGMRYEFTYMGLRYKTGIHSDITVKMSYWVPNLSLSYNISSATNVRLSYSNRISRPGIDIMNPWKNELTPGTISYGNPDLKSVRNHLFSLNYSNYEGKLSGSAGFQYRYIANAIGNIQFIKDGIINSTYANIGKSHYFTLDLDGNWSITNDLRINVYVSGTYQDLRADSELIKAHNSGWQCTLGGNLSWTMPCKIRLSAWGGYWSPWMDIDTKGYSGYYYGIGLTRSFLEDDKLTLSLSAKNFFNPSRKDTYTESNSTMVVHQSWRYDQWALQFSISFKIGGLKTGVKKTAVSIEKETGAAAADKK